MALRVGDTVGDYQIIGVLGRGGMGEVFRARNLISDRVEAMKVVLPGAQASPELADRFLREIKLLASLDHPNIAGLHTALRVDDQILMVMELVEGVNLADRLHDGPVDWRDAVRYVDQVLSALAFAHNRGVIHRDIKPANIIVTSGGVVKLTDFGIARLAGDPRLTSTGMALGSLYYMSPEQVKSAPLDGRSDLYSLAVTLYELVTGKRPIHGDSEYALMTAHLTQVPAPPTELNPNIPPALSAIVLKALEKDPANRYQSAADFQAALHGQESATPPPAAGRLSGSASPPPPTVFDAEVLATIEARLLPLLGPVTHQLVDRVARRSQNVQELCLALVEQIPEPGIREAFMRSVQNATGAQPTAARTTSVPAAAATGAAPVWDAAVLRAAKEKLAAHIGPIAGVIVERTAKKVHTKRELFAALAREIPSERDREKFLSSLG